jgi:hypothetical protein
MIGSIVYLPSFERASLSFAAIGIFLCKSEISKTSLMVEFRPKMTPARKLRREVGGAPCKPGVSHRKGRRRELQYDSNWNID